MSTALATLKPAAGSSPASGSTPRPVTLADLTANPIVSVHENVDDYRCLAETLFEEHRPATGHELFLVRQMLVSRWRIHRFERIQGLYLDGLIFAGAQNDEHLSPDELLAIRTAGEYSTDFQSIERYIAAATRAYYRAHRELITARKQNAAITASQAVIEAKKRQKRIDSLLDPDYEDFLRVPSPAPNPTRKGQPRFQVEPGENLALRL